MVFLKLVDTEYQVNHKTQPFWVKVVHLVPNVQTLAGHDVGAIRLAPTTTLHFDTVLLKTNALSFYVTKTVLVGPKLFWSDQLIWT